MKHAAAFALLTLFACGKSAPKPPPAKPALLALADDMGHAVATLTPDDTITDGSGTVVGRVDWKVPVVVVGGTRETLAYDLEDKGISVVTSMRTFHVLVDDATTELLVDNEPAGKLSGFSRTKTGWERLAALVLAVPMLPAPPPPTHSSNDVNPPPAGTSPPPPPPPPPPGH